MTMVETESVFVRRLAAAVRAAWWAFLIGVVLVTAQFSLYCAVSQCDAFWSWMARLLAVGSGNNVREVILFFIVAIRAVLVTWLLASIFLTLWLRRFRRVGDA